MSNNSSDCTTVDKIECAEDIDNDIVDDPYNDLDVSTKSLLEEWDKFDIVERKLRPVYLRICKSKNTHSAMLNKTKNGYKPLTYPPLLLMKGRDKGRSFRNFDLISTYEQQKQNKDTNDHSYSAYCKSKLDPHELLVIKRLIDKQLLVRVNDIINIGYSAITFHADCNLYPNKILPQTCVIKVFKKARSKREDSAALLSQREVRALKILKGVIPCPELIHYKQCVVVLSIIGYAYQPAPRIEDVVFDDKQYVTLYKQIIEAMRDIFRKGNLVCGYLNSRNILWHHKKCYFVNFSGYQFPHERDAMDSLQISCYEITDFFKDKDIPGKLTMVGLFEYITGYNFNELVKNCAKHLGKRKNKHGRLK